MAGDATIRRVARPRGDLDSEQRRRIENAKWHLDEAQEAYRNAVLSVLRDGCSFSEVSRESGLSTSTLQRWKREAAS